MPAQFEELPPSDVILTVNSATKSPHVRPVIAVIPGMMQPAPQLAVVWLYDDPEIDHVP
jgi:hypothetical protein